MKIYNIGTLYTGQGFAEKKGRYIRSEDIGKINGPVSIEICDKSGKILSIDKNHPTVSSNDINANGASLTASFNDSHTHSIFSGSRAFEYFMRWQGESYIDIGKAGGGILHTFQSTANSTDEELLQLLKLRIQEMRRYGTAHIEVKSGYGKDPVGELRLLRLIKRYKEENNDQSIHANFLGLHALPKGIREHEYVQEMSEIIRTVKKENLASFIDAFPEEGFFSLASALRFCEEGEKQGLKAKVHADEITDMCATEYFVQRNAVSVDHLQKVNRNGLALLAQKDTVATVLPATSFYLGIEYVDARRLLDNGAQVALATDYNPGTAPESLMNFTNLLAANTLKMSTAEILCGSTYNGAAALELQENTGIIAKGFEANILFWNKENYTCLEEILLSKKAPDKVLFKGKTIES